ncbi:hypothetical protein ACMFMF_011351 [Clarireedia jacksonii]
MSSLLRTSIIRAARPASRSSVAFHNARAFTNSSAMSLKESHDKSDPNLPNELEKHKHDQLSKQKQGTNHWKAELASNSEEAVAADRHEHSDHSEEGIKELQRQTAKHAEEKHK